MDTRKVIARVGKIRDQVDRCMRSKSADLERALEDADQMLTDLIGDLRAGRP